MSKLPKLLIVILIIAAVIYLFKPQCATPAYKGNGNEYCITTFRWQIILFDLTGVKLSF